MSISVYLTFKAFLAFQRKPLFLQDRILYQNAKEDLEKSRLELDTIVQQKKTLQDENEALRLQVKALKGEVSPEPQPPGSKEASVPEGVDDLEPLKDLKEEDDAEIDSAATESAPGSSQPQSPGSPASPFDVDSAIYRPMPIKHDVRPHEEDEYGPPTLTREQD